MVTPDDVLKQLALAAGYRVHVWNAIENGDEADSYFWKAAGASKNGAQSITTFPTTELAWRDCWEVNRLFAPIEEEIREAGCTVVREPGFIAYRWVDRDGEVSSERFSSEAEPIIACAIGLADCPLDIEGAAPSL